MTRPRWAQHPGLPWSQARVPVPHLVGLKVIVQGELQLAQVLGLLLLLALTLALRQACLRIVIILGG